MPQKRKILRGLISIEDLTKQEILLLLKNAKKMKHDQKPRSILKGKILASCFFEPSTRTRLSFEAAMIKLGGNVIGFSDPANTSLAKGESLEDTLKVIEGYADILIFRHPTDGSAKKIREVLHKPIINAGDGMSEHPSQTLTDLFSIQECQDSLEKIHIAMMGDLKHSRTIQSLSLACSLFNMHLYFVSSPSLSPNQPLLDTLKSKAASFSLHHDVEKILNKIDILYLTRLQKERFSEKEYPEVRPLISLQLLKKAKKNLKILHPLPRLEELPKEIDTSPYAYYFQQAENGLFVREALLAWILHA
ncbi:MAG: aspartate carbamoyltransferase [Chlamydiae bacterium]|nr:aspartate carbamoyltransferase [Chlamydiota bacterium]